jgi:hypothetical protein
MALTVATIEAAIEKIMTGGQSVSVDGVMYSQANLSALHALREKIMAETGRSSRPMIRGVNFGSMGYSL